MSCNPDDHLMAEAILNVTRQAGAFYERERNRVQREFYQAHGLKPAKTEDGKKYSDRLRERFAQKRAKGD